jgi:ureidoglycolate hydrolase
MNLTPLTPETFAAFGQIVPGDNAPGTRFEVKLTEAQPTGWRMAVLAVESGVTDELHRHPQTAEVFEVLDGAVVLLVAPPETPDAISAFFLDQAVCVSAKVWHATIALGRRAVVRITENATVSKETHRIAPVRVGLLAARVPELAG